MSNSYLKFLLSVAFCLNLFLGYYFVYTFFFKKEENNDDLISQKEAKIQELDKINKEKQILIDSLQTQIDKTEQNTIVIKEKIKDNKNEEKNIKTRINNMDDATLIRELSNEQFEFED